MSYVNLTKIEQGKIPNPGIQAIYKIAKSLEIEIGALVE
jgi:transcriptional regulator with XRE-family HTH domain